MAAMLDRLQCVIRLFICNVHCTHEIFILFCFILVYFQFLMNLPIFFKVTIVKLSGNNEVTLKYMVKITLPNHIKHDKERMSCIIFGMYCIFRLISWRRNSLYLHEINYLVDIQATMCFIWRRMKNNKVKSSVILRKYGVINNVITS